MNQFIRQIFSEVSRTYERANRIFTLGRDVSLRKKVVSMATLGNNGRYLDVCTGTGETAIMLSDKVSAESQIVAIDFSPEMVEMATAKPEAQKILFVLGDVASLPFRDESFDVITLTFATRNITANRASLLQCLREFLRVLKPGGRYINLETSQPSAGPVRWLFHALVKTFVPFIGQAISGSKAGYKYLSQSIPLFYGADEFSEIIREAGFEDVRCTREFLGAVAIHFAVK